MDMDVFRNFLGGLDDDGPNADAKADFDDMDEVVE